MYAIWENPSLILLQKHPFTIRCKCTNPLHTYYTNFRSQSLESPKLVIPLLLESINNLYYVWYLVQGRVIFDLLLLLALPLFKFNFYFLWSSQWSLIMHFGSSKRPRTRHTRTSIPTCLLSDPTQVSKREVNYYKILLTSFFFLLRCDEIPLFMHTWNAPKRYTCWCV